jgi:cytidyltransferase-like protein
MIIYCDGCFDLIHYGHYNFLKIAKSKADKLIVGIHNDKQIENYKRIPILTMEQRVPMLEGCKYVDEIIIDSPLILTNEFLKEHNIDAIVIPTNRKKEEIEEWYKDLEVFIISVPYTSEISTSNIINKLKTI